MSLSILLLSPIFYAKQTVNENKSPQKKHERTQSFLMSKYLSQAHFNRKNRKVDDELSKAAFKFLIERFDPQKTVFLQKDIASFKAYELKIDDEFLNGEFKLIRLVSQRYNENKLKQNDYSQSLLKKGFDFNKKEQVELDGDKLDYAKTYKELEDRWRKRLKYRVISRYLVYKARETKKSKNKKTTQLSSQKVKELQNKAIDKISKELAGEKLRVQERDHQDDLTLYYNTITNTYDPHTVYMSPMNKKDFDIRISRSLTGIGVRLRRDDEGFIKITEVLLGSAAHREGSLRSGDIVLSVAQGKEGSDRVDTVGMKLQEFRELVLGEKGTTVQLEVKKLSGEVENVSIVRDIIQLEDAVAKSNVMKAEGRDDAFGYIHLPSFYRDFSKKTNNTCTKDVIREIKKLKESNIKGLVFDLRNNGGGALKDAISISGLFIEKGPIVQVKDTMGRINIYRDKDRHIEYDGPLVILINQFSASASEIMAGALQDYGRAVIVGAGQTHGKGTVQNIIPIRRNRLVSKSDPDYGALKLTIQKFYRVTGSSTQNKGVMPDIVLPSEYIYTENGERFKEFAMPWGKIKDVSFKKWSTKSIDPKLQKKSDSRTKQDDKFTIIKDRFEYLKTYTEDTLWPLEIEAFSLKQKSHRDRIKHYDSILEIENDDRDIEEQEEENFKFTPEQLKEKREKEWLKDLKRDPYVKESLNILSDIIDSEAA